MAKVLLVKKAERLGFSQSFKFRVFHFGDILALGLIVDSYKMLDLA